MTTARDKILKEFQDDNYGFIEIYCDHKSHPRQIIARMWKSTRLTDGKWEQREPLSNQRFQELRQWSDRQETVDLTVEDGTAIEVDGELHNDWDFNIFVESIADRPRTDKPYNHTFIVDGQPQTTPLAQTDNAEIYKKYEFKCPRCHIGRAPIERRDEKLTPVFEALHTAGITEVSWQLLARSISHYDKTQK